MIIIIFFILVFLYWLMWFSMLIALLCLFIVLILRLEILIWFQVMILIILINWLLVTLLMSWLSLLSYEMIFFRLKVFTKENFKILHYRFHVTNHTCKLLIHVINWRLLTGRTFIWSSVLSLALIIRFPIRKVTVWH